MRLGNVAVAGSTRLCVRVDDDTVIDVLAADPAAPGTIEAVLADPAIALAALAAAVRTAPASARIRPAELGPPVPRPGKIIGVGLNYREHAEEPAETPAPQRLP